MTDAERALAAREDQTTELSTWRTSPPRGRHHGAGEDHHSLDGVIAETILKARYR